MWSLLIFWSMVRIHHGPPLRDKGFGAIRDPSFFSAIGLLFRKMVTPPPTNQQLVERQLKLAML
ncbi:hypothetical protein B9Y66_01015 [Stenotrophomonas maltophilia]|nr:hypothetical protein B9Y66_01015 [Stenotrophomonas maltophilia]